LHALNECIEIKNRIGSKEEYFDMMVQLKIVLNEEIINLDESVKKIDALIP